MNQVQDKFQKDLKQAKEQIEPVVTWVKKHPIAAGIIIFVILSIIISAVFPPEIDRDTSLKASEEAIRMDPNWR